MNMIPILYKIALRPIARGLDALLEKLQAQIANGQKEQAAETVGELRQALDKAREYLK